MPIVSIWFFKRKNNQDFLFVVYLNKLCMHHIKLAIRYRRKQFNLNILPAIFEKSADHTCIFKIDKDNNKKMLFGTIFEPYINT